MAGLRSELQALHHEASRLRDDADRNKRQAAEVSNRMKRKAEERNQLKREIMELKNAQEEEETEVDTATYVSHLISANMVLRGSRGFQKNASISQGITDQC